MGLVSEQNIWSTDRNAPVLPSDVNEMEMNYLSMPNSNTSKTVDVSICKPIIIWHQDKVAADWLSHYSGGTTKDAWQTSVDVGVKISVAPKILKGLHFIQLEKNETKCDICSGKG